MPLLRPPPPSAIQFPFFPPPLHFFPYGKLPSRPFPLPLSTRSGPARIEQFSVAPKWPSFFPVKRRKGLQGSALISVFSGRKISSTVTSPCNLCCTRPRWATAEADCKQTSLSLSFPSPSLSCMVPKNYICVQVHTRKEGRRGEEGAITCRFRKRGRAKKGPFEQKKGEKCGRVESSSNPCPPSSLSST